MISLWLRTWLIGAKSMALHPMRSALTVLGIFIGVASVIWLLAIGEGISNKAQEQIASLGADNIIVRSIKPPADTGESGFSMNDYGVKRDDFMRLISTVPSIKHALPIRELRQRFTYNDKKLDGRLVGCTPEYATLNSLVVERGRFISDADVRADKNYCVLASNTADFLFPVQNPLGKDLKVKDRFYVVVGVMKSRTPSAGIGGSLSAQDFSNDVYIPITTL
jgi:putative ABC transport system permease protein